MPRQRKVSAEKIATLFREGKTRIQIGQEAGCHFTTVNYHLERMGLIPILGMKRRSPDSFARRREGRERSLRARDAAQLRFDRETAEMIRLYTEEKWKQQAIGKKFGVHRKTVAARLKRRGVIFEVRQRAALKPPPPPVPRFRRQEPTERVEHLLRLASHRTRRAA